MQNKRPLLTKEYGNQIYAVDTLYLDRENFAAVFLLAGDHEVAVVETNTNHAVPLILQGISERGWQPDQVKYVIVTHIHLDHAGGTGRLMEELPQATLVVHPSGKKHMVNPEKLAASAKGVYGEERFKKLYGDIRPVAEERIVSSEEGMILSLGRRELHLFNTPGHAYHHHALFDNQSGSVFSGDAFGIGYPRFSEGEERLMFPSTSPTQFDPQRTISSIQRIVDFKPTQVLLTHFGVVRDIKGASEQLIRWVDFSVAAAQQRYGEGYGGEDLVQQLEKDLWKRYRELSFAMFKRDFSLDERAFLELDAEINAQGLAHYIQKKQP